MKYCIYCGESLSDSAMFCSKCGKKQEKGKVEETKERVKSINQKDINKDYDSKYNDYNNSTQNDKKSKSVKCPNCGEIIDSFTAFCPSCGHEIRDVKSNDSIKELAMKLQEIESKQMPQFNEDKSMMKKVFGRDFKNDDKIQEAEDRFEEQKSEEKASLIRNYPVPNTKEDVMEFMLLAISNLNESSSDVTLENAWLSKMDQIYEKAKIIMGDKAEFDKLTEMYTKSKNNYKRKNRLPFIIIFAIFVLNVIALAFFNNPSGTIIVLVLIICGGLFAYKKYQEYKHK